MNTQFASILFALVFPLTVAASPGGHHKGDFEHYRAKKIERLNQELSLTDDQKTQLETLFKQQGEKVKAVRKETRSQLQSILTPEQHTKLQELKQRRHAEWREKRQARKLEKSQPAQ
jgi:protein CpxP